MIVRLIVGCLASASALGLSACQETMIPTPYVMYGEAGRQEFERVPAELRHADIPVLYVTDRLAERVGANGPEYGCKRNPSMEFGVATVRLGEEVEWDQLVADSTSGKRSRTYVPRVVKIEKTGGFKALPQRLDAYDGRARLKPGSYAEMLVEQEQLFQLVTRWSAYHHSDEALVFIHGFNNTFDDAAKRLAQAWHVGGRQGVPIVYTWPGGSGGIKGYAYDRESGEFTNVHLKMFLMTLAKCAQIRKIHIVSHSRGTDVAVTALRELHSEVRGLERMSFLVADEVMAQNSEFIPTPTYERLKIDTLVLAAPDLDMEVFAQRFFGENAIQSARRVIVYFSAEDSALSLSDWLFRSKRRIGDLHLDDIPVQSRHLFGQITALQLINCKVTGGSSHAYVMQHPAALSDLLLVLKGDAPPGAEHGRPLTQPFEGVWEMDNEYLRPGAPARR